MKERKHFEPGILYNFLRDDDGNLSPLRECTLCGAHVHRDRKGEHDDEHRAAGEWPPQSGEYREIGEN